MNHRSLHAGLALIAVAGATLAACGGAQKPEDGSIEALLAAPPTATASADADAPPKPEKASKDEDLNDAQKEQMEVALRRGGDKAANCSSVVPDALKGDGEVKVTFDGKKGRAVDVSVPAPWAGTDAEGCIKRAFIGEIIVPFEGTLEVPYGIHVGPKADASKGAKDAKSAKDAKGKTQKK